MTQPEPQDVQAWFDLEDEQFEAGDYNAAIASYDKIIKLNPDDYQAWRNRGIILGKLKCYEEAISSFDKALELQPNDHQAWCNRGITLGVWGRYEEAIFSFDKALELQPNDHQAWGQRAITRRNFGHNVEAVKSFDKAIEVIEIKPNDHQAWRNWGITLGKWGCYEEAIPSFDKAIQLNPDDHKTWRYKGITLGKWGRYEEAIPSFDKAIQLNPDDHKTWRYKGMTLSEAERHKEAILSFDKALELKPNYHEAWHERGVALSKERSYQEAISSFDKALELKPNYHEAWYSRGIALLELGRHEEAILSFDKAIELKPYIQYEHKRDITITSLGTPEEAIAKWDKALEQIRFDLSYLAWKERGEALLQLDRYEEAIASWDKTLEFRPDLHDLWHQRGNVLFELGRYEEAIASYDKALKIQPNLHLAQEQRGDALFKLGYFEQAIKSYKQVLEIDEHNSRALIKIGNVRFEMGDYQEALDAYEQALEIDRYNYEALLKLGDICFELGDYDKALDAYSKTVRIKPDEYEPWYKCGKVQFELRGYEEAIASYNSALNIQADKPEASYNLGMALVKLGRFKEASESYKKALKIQPNNQEVWYEHGNALFYLGFYKKAVESYDKALEIQPDNEEAWYKRGNALLQLHQYREALYSYEETLRLAPDHHQAWNCKGNAYKSLDELEEAITAYDRALEHSDKQSWRAWKNRGWLVWQLRGSYQEVIDDWYEGIDYLYPEKSRDHQRGYGELHYAIGKLQYQQGQRRRSPIYWKDARASYQDALDYLTADQFRKRHLEVLQDLITVCLGLGEVDEADGLLVEGTNQLQRLLKDTPKPKQIELRRKFAPRFNQWRVDALAQSPDPGKQTKALEWAEECKNLCLSWFRDGSETAQRSPKYSEIQRTLLNSETAAIYWHLSPAALTTFVLRHDQPPDVLFAESTSDESNYSPLALQLRKFESWMKRWKRGYQDYSDSKDEAVDINLPEVANRRQAKESYAWRLQMRIKLEELAKEILDIPRISTQLVQEGFKHLILIPHRDLHLLPLHALFPDDVTITYLPSAQTGLDLQSVAPPLGGTYSNLPLLSIEHPQTTQTQDKVKPFDGKSLLYAEMESAAITQMYQLPNRRAGGDCSLEAVIQALKQTSGIFHFTGHAYHDIDSPADSALLLANTDQLKLRDIFDKKLDFRPYHLICLSACETGKTAKQDLIDEFVGLASGFLAAGTSCVVSTLWRVDEISAALLMVRFYQLLQKYSPAAALREAQLWLRDATYKTLAQWCRDVAKELADYSLTQSENWEDAADSFQEQVDRMDSNNPPYACPYYWAAFTITGN